MSRELCSSPAKTAMRQTDDYVAAAQKGPNNAFRVIVDSSIGSRTVRAATAPAKTRGAPDRSVDRRGDQ
jgi:hypothetical protein